MDELKRAEKNQVLPVLHYFGIRDQKNTLGNPPKKKKRKKTM